MSDYAIVLKPSVEKDLRQITKTNQLTILEKVESLAQNPFPLNVLKLTGTERSYRIRIGKVGSKQPNPIGLMDVHGNVAEWCWDRHGTYPTGIVSDYVYTADPGSACVLRGGIGFDDATYCHSADRMQFLPGNRFSLLGFRLVRTVN